MSIKGFYGNFFLMATDLVQLPNVNPDNCYALEATIEKDLTSEQFISFQSAVLHTSNNGDFIFKNCYFKYEDFTKYLNILLNIIYIYIIL